MVKSTTFSQLKALCAFVKCYLGVGLVINIIKTCLSRIDLGHEIFDSLIVCHLQLYVDIFGMPLEAKPREEQTFLVIVFRCSEMKYLRTDTVRLKKL